jgi:uncharacterized protein with FMN-binding domain
MLRAVLALGGTAAGLAALLSFKTHVPAAAAPVAAPAASTSTTSAAGSPAGSPAKKTSGSPTKAMAGSGTPTQNATVGSAAATATRTITGSVANTQYGPMQVQLTVTGTKITKAAVVQQTDDGQTSQQIDANAIPKLEQETLVAQSARVDAVSGASYTSSGYIQSLQSALDKVTA